MRMFRCAAVLTLTSALVAALVVSCASADDKPDYSPASYFSDATTDRSDVPHDGGDGGDRGDGGDGGGGGDAGKFPIPGPGDSCGTLANSGIVKNIAVAGAVPPFNGGLVGAGTFHLVARNHYTGSGGASGPTGEITASAIAFDGDHFQQIAADGYEDGGLDASARIFGIYSFESANKVFNRRGQCPLTQLLPVYYDLSGGTLRLLDIANAGGMLIGDEYVYERD